MDDRQLLPSFNVSAWSCTVLQFMHKCISTTWDRLITSLGIRKSSQARPRGRPRVHTRTHTPRREHARAHTQTHTHTHAHISPPSGISFPPPRPHPTRHRSQVITDHSTELPVLYSRLPLASISRMVYTPTLLYQFVLPLFLSFQTLKLSILLFFSSAFVPAQSKKEKTQKELRPGGVKGSKLGKY